MASVLIRSCKDGTWSSLCLTSLKSPHSVSRSLTVDLCVGVLGLKSEGCLLLFDVIYICFRSQPRNLKVQSQDLRKSESSPIGHLFRSITLTVRHMLERPSYFRILIRILSSISPLFHRLQWYVLNYLG